MCVCVCLCVCLCFTVRCRHIARHTKDVSPERVLRVISELGRSCGSQGLVGGQVVDIQSENKKMEPEEGLKTLEYIHKHKTAVLLEAAVVGGAILGGANDEDVEKLRMCVRHSPPSPLSLSLSRSHFR